MYGARLGIALVALSGLLPLAAARADSPSVTAVLSNSEAAVGQMVQLEIRVQGANEANIPDITVDGLEIHPTGTSRQFEMRNLTVNSSVTYNYTILPLKAGMVKIPPQTIRAGASSLRTPELTLHVVDAAGGRNPTVRSNPSNGSSPATVDTSKFVFAELIVPKKSAYVGEMIPVVVRIGFATRVLGLDGPEITGQGFTMQKLHQSEQPQLESINGRQMEVYTFKTAVAAARPGKFEIGPVKATAKMIVATRPRSSRSRSPFDIFNMDDPFSDPFFADPFGRTGERRDVPIVSEAAPLEVKPLPAGAPANFSGAVGNFNMTVDANPKNVQVGDPITVTSTIGGRGNFDRVTGPALEDERGWHKYPPSSKFKQDDDVGISGTKTFEMVLSPNEKKQSISPLVFSYFDPAKETYVTLRNDVIPIHVEGSATAALPAASATPAPAATQASAPAARPTPKPQDILYQLTERPTGAQSFTPLYARPNFWLAQIIPFLALLGLIGWKVRQSRLDNREAQRIAALHHEATELVRKLRRDDSSPQIYFSQATRAVQVKTALASRHGGIEPNMVDAETAATTFQLDENSRDQLRRLFERSDELRYSGAHNGAETISPESRREVLGLVESLRA